MMMLCSTSFNNCQLFVWIIGLDLPKSFDKTDVWITIIMSVSEWRMKDLFRKSTEAEAIIYAT